jgi:hypothetical protein
MRKMKRQIAVHAALLSLSLSDTTTTNQMEIIDLENTNVHCPFASDAISNNTQTFSTTPIRGNSLSCSSLAILAYAALNKQR